MPKKLYLRQVGQLKICFSTHLLRRQDAAASSSAITASQTYCDSRPVDLAVSNETLMNFPPTFFILVALYPALPACALLPQISHTCPIH